MMINDAGCRKKTLLVVGGHDGCHVMCVMCEVMMMDEDLRGYDGDEEENGRHSVSIIPNGVLSCTTARARTKETVSFLSVVVFRMMMMNLLLLRPPANAAFITKLPMPRPKPLSILAEVGLEQR
jgi:hypothetical protein